MFAGASPSSVVIGAPSWKTMPEMLPAGISQKL